MINKDEDYNEFIDHRWQKLRQLVAYLNITVTRIAEETGVSLPLLQACLYKYRSVSDRTVSKICERYGIDIDYFDSNIQIQEILPQKGVDHSFSSAPEDTDSFQTRMRFRRVQLHYSQRMLAEKCGINKATVTLIESGKTTPGKSAVDKIADALQVPVEWLLEGEGQLQDYPITSTVLCFLEEKESRKRRKRHRV